MAESFDLLDEEVDVLESGGGVGDDHPEEVHLVSLGLVAHHGGAVLHHPGLYHRRHLPNTADTRGLVFRIKCKAWLES